MDAGRGGVSLVVSVNLITKLKARDKRKGSKGMTDLMTRIQAIKGMLQVPLLSQSNDTANSYAASLTHCADFPPPLQFVTTPI